MTMTLEKEHSAYSERMRTEIDELLNRVTTLDDEQKHSLRECYIQQNTVYSAAVKLGRTETEVSLWYFYISTALARNAVREML